MRNCDDGTGISGNCGQSRSKQPGISSGMAKPKKHRQLARMTAGFLLQLLSIVPAFSLKQIGMHQLATPKDFRLLPADDTLLPVQTPALPSRTTVLRNLRPTEASQPKNQDAAAA